MKRASPLKRGTKLRAIGKRGRASRDEFATIRPCVLSRDSYTCRRCKDPSSKPLDVHHRKPRSRGGQHTMENLVTLCRLCHSAVHDGAPDWREWVIGRKAAK
jgi:5-methylcytosine-specific restriction endonuclease McrA